MAVNVGTVVLNVEADSTKLNKGLKEAQKKTQKSFSSMKKSMSSFTKVAGVAVAAVTAFSVKVINDLDKVNKVAGKLGTTTDQLSSLGYAAERAGVSANTFQMAMQRMVRRSAEAAKGIGEAKAAFKELNINAKNFNNLSLEEKMYKLSDALTKVQNPADQLRLSFKLFDSEGAALINMLKNGSGEIKTFQKASDDLGRTIKQKTADSASQAADSITNFNSALTGIVNTMANKFLPSINAGLNAIQDFFNIARQKNAKELEKQIYELTNSLIDLQDKISNGNTLNWGGADLLKEKAKKTQIEIDKLTKQYVGLKNEIKRKAQLKIDFKNAQDTITATEKTKKALKSLTDEFLPLEAATKKYQENFKLLNDSFENGKISEEQYTTILDGMKKKLEEASGATEELSNKKVEIKVGVSDFEKQMNEITDVSKGVADTIGSAMEGAFSDMLDGTFNMKKTMISLLKDIAKELIKTLIIKKAVEGISNFMEGSLAGSSIANNSSYTNVNTPTLSDFGNNNSGINLGSSISSPTTIRHSQGGIVNTPTNFSMNNDNKKGLLGEVGPEAIVPLQRTSSGALGVQSSPVNVIVNNNNNSNVKVEQNGSDIKILIDNVEQTIASNINKGRGPVPTAIQTMKSQGKI